MYHLYSYRFLRSSHRFECTQYTLITHERIKKIKGTHLQTHTNTRIIYKYRQTKPRGKITSISPDYIINNKSSSVFGNCLSG